MSSQSYGAVLWEVFPPPSSFSSNDSVAKGRSALIMVDALLIKWGYVGVSSSTKKDDEPTSGLLVGRVQFDSCQ